MQDLTRFGARLQSVIGRGRGCGASGPLIRRHLGLRVSATASELYHYMTGRFNEAYSFLTKAAIALLCLSTAFPLFTAW